MQTVTLVCDLCGAMATTDEERKRLDLGSVIVGVNQTQYYSGWAPTISGGHKEWNKDACGACRTKLGLTPEEVRKNPETPKLTLEELLREIMREEIAESQGSNQ